MEGDDRCQRCRGVSVSVCVRSGEKRQRCGQSESPVKEESRRLHVNLADCLEGEERADGGNEYPSGLSNVSCQSVFFLICSISLSNSFAVTRSLTEL